MLDLLRGPYYFLIVGMFLIFLGVVYTYTGKAWIRFRGWAYRAEDPRRYWMGVAAYYFCGVGSIGYFLYEVRAL